MTMHGLDVSKLDPTWVNCLEQGLSRIDQAYLDSLLQAANWLPGQQKIFNAFKQPLHKTQYVLFGESPYPRSESANGYAFWDAAVKEIWSDNGLSKRVNRATSLRNMIKMLLIAEGLLRRSDTSQPAIAAIDKSQLVQTCDELFQNFIDHGFLLLNATPVLQPYSRPHKDARAWLPFTQEILSCLLKQNPQVTFLLWGNIANTIDQLIAYPCKEKLYAEHPYNLSFITNERVINFFQPLHLLLRK